MHSFNQSQYVITEVEIEDWEASEIYLLQESTYNTPILRNTHREFKRSHMIFFVQVFILLTFLPSSNFPFQSHVKWHTEAHV